ncbi:LPCAT3 [Mytilus edulis]|uniref:Lysophospholipid acyltransferase 5 n=1 Tax=Mytilus edulis TaxID=6550 RepID=A0A8S3UBN8_MYTED|nr:LPCAT3 [Mytilus edulis]
MIWGYICWNGVSTPTREEGNINAVKYQEILDENLWPVIARHFLGGNYFFQDDNAPVHRAPFTQEIVARNGINEEVINLQSFQFSQAHSFDDTLNQKLYLVIAYYKCTDQTLTWTTPQCVICLRLTAVVFDVYDGQKSKEKLSEDQKESAISEVPSLLAICGQTYYFGTFLAGPQGNTLTQCTFNIKRYLQFVNGEFDDPLHKGPSRSVGPGLTRMSIGILYIAMYQIGGLLFNEEHMLSDDFMKMIYLKQFSLRAVCGEITHKCCMLNREAEILALWFEILVLWFDLASTSCTRVEHETSMVHEKNCDFEVV